MPRRPSAKQLVQARKRFKAALTNFVVSKGATQGSVYDHQLNTPAGLLHVSVYGTWIATRFDDVELGKRFTANLDNRCHSETGRWDYHYPGGSLASLDAEETMADFGDCLDRLMSWQPAAAISGDGRQKETQRTRRGQ